LRLKVDEKGAFHPLNGDGSLPEQASGLTVPPEPAEMLAGALAKFSDDVDDLERSFGPEIDPIRSSRQVLLAAFSALACRDDFGELLLNRKGAIDSSQELEF
jgi:hypothetical protein